MLHINEITYRIGGRTLLENASVHVPKGHRVGLVGRNGSGKTTLLRIITGGVPLDGGTVRVRARARIGMIAQEAPGGSTSPLDAVLAADTQRAELLKRAETAQDGAEIADIHDKLVDINAHSAPARAATILAGLGFDDDEQSRPLSSFSGGWRMRVALAAALFSEPDLLLLDEPTNHLDLEATLWLENYLASYPHTLIIVSHDRSLLCNSVNHILHLRGKSLEMYKGDYEKFEEARFRKQFLSEAVAKKQAAAAKRMQDFIERFRAKATKARQAQSRLKLLGRMQPVVVPSVEKAVEFHFPDPGSCPSPLVRLDDVSVGYDKKAPVLANLRASIYAEDRIALLGANGNGKTTLARLLADELIPFSGKVVKTAKLRIGYFAQDQLEQLDSRLTVLGQMSLRMPDDPQQKVRGWLGRFGFGQEKVDVPVSALSGGEKTRLALALVALGQPNLLVLDEPTNHLDVDARKSLTNALLEYSGAIVLVSHDRYLIETTVDQLWLVQGGTVSQFHGDIEEYRSYLLSEKRARRDAKENDNRDGDKKRPGREARRQKAEIRARLAPLKKEVQKAEERLEELTKEKSQIDETLSDPQTYAQNQDRVPRLTQRQKELELAIELAEEKWLEAQTALEDQTALESDLGEGEN